MYFTFENLSFDVSHMHVHPFLWLSKNFSRFEGGHFVFARYSHQGARSRGLSSFLKTLDPILSPCQILKFVQDRKYCGDQKDIPTQLFAQVQILANEALW